MSRSYLLWSPVIVRPNLSGRGILSHGVSESSSFASDICRTPTRHKRLLENPRRGPRICVARARLGRPLSPMRDQVAYYVYRIGKPSHDKNWVPTNVGQPASADNPSGQA